MKTEPTGLAAPTLSLGLIGISKTLIGIDNKAASPVNSTLPVRVTVIVATLLSSEISYPASNPLVTTI